MVAVEEENPASWSFAVKKDNYKGLRSGRDPWNKLWELLTSALMDSKDSNSRALAPNLGFLLRTRAHFSWRWGDRGTTRAVLSPARRGKAVL